MIKNCEWCGKEFEAKSERAKYCCGNCKNKHRNDRNKIEKACLECGITFIDASQNHNLKFCSTSCGSKYTHKNNSIKIVSCKVCGDTFEFKGTTSPKYCRSCRKIERVKITTKSKVKNGKMSADKVGIGSGNGYVGKDSPFFKTGIGIYKRLKKESMDELKCEICNSTKFLEVHHKDHNRENNELDNLILLCKSCHKKEHIHRDEFGRFIKK